MSPLPALIYTTRCALAAAMWNAVMYVGPGAVHLDTVSYSDSASATAADTLSAAAASEATAAGHSPASHL